MHALNVPKQAIQRQGVPTSGQMSGQLHKIKGFCLKIISVITRATELDQIVVFRCLIVKVYSEGLS